jgi:cytochrome b subunit of formate dehydrogenase
MRNTVATRINHWISAGCFIWLPLSGLSMFSSLARYPDFIA